MKGTSRAHSKMVALFSACPLQCGHWHVVQADKLYSRTVLTRSAYGNVGSLGCHGHCPILALVAMDTVRSTVYMCCLISWWFIGLEVRFTHFQRYQVVGRRIVFYKTRKDYEVANIRPMIRLLTRLWEASLYYVKYYYNKCNKEQPCESWRWIGKNSRGSRGAG